MLQNRASIFNKVLLANVLRKTPEIEIQCCPFDGNAVGVADGVVACILDGSVRLDMADSAVAIVLHGTI